jgi:hypothetical protein
MSTISFAAAFNADTRSASMDAAPSGFVVQTESENRRFRTYRQALSFVHEHLGRFPAPAERLPAELWGLVVTVSAGSAFYGGNLPWASSGGGAVAPAELLSKIRREYRDGDGPLQALKNAIAIARAYPPNEERAAA